VRWKFFHVSNHYRNGAPTPSLPAGRCSPA
jgi:hypothetical protein